MAAEEVERNVTPAKLDEPRLTNLAKTLRAMYSQYKKDRRNAEQQWVKNLRQYEGEYDPDVCIEEGMSHAYPRVTRRKVLGMVARLMALLFPEGDSNWGVQASAYPSVDQDTLQWIIGRWASENPDAVVDLDVVEKEVKRFADEAAQKMSTRIEDQLNDAAEYGQKDYPSLARKVIESAVKYGMGVLKGPMTIEAKGVTYSEDDQGNIVIHNDTVYRPYFEFVSLFDYYPDMHVKEFDQMDGKFQRHIMSKHQLRRLAKREDFWGDKVGDVIRRHPQGNYTLSNIDTEVSGLQASHNATPTNNDTGKYEVVEFWGIIDRKDLEAADVDLSDMDEDENEVAATLWFVENEVIKAARDPFPEGAEMYHHFVFEEDDINLAGKGLPQVMRDSQMAISNATRMMLDNASWVAGPMAEIDVSLLSPRNRSIQLKPMARFFKETDSSTPTNARLVNSISLDSHLAELLSIVQHFKTEADEETFVSSTPGGDISGEALRTQGNMSMVMGNSSLPFRDIVRNYDDFTISVIYSLIQWNRMFNPETHIDGDLRPLAKGSTTLMAKEVRAYTLDNLAQTLTDEERDYIDMGELAEQRVKVRDLPPQLMLSEDKVQENLDRKAQAQANAQQLAEAMQVAELRATEAQHEQRQADALKKRVEAGVDLQSGVAQVRTLEPVAGEPTMDEGQQGVGQ